MSDAKLQKLILGPDWIDLSFGEPTIVLQSLFRNINRVGDPMKMPTLMDIYNCTYQPAQGKPDLVSILEDKYKAKVVVTNGAKHGLGAALSAFKNEGISTTWYAVPYYPANPGLVNAAGLAWSEMSRADSYLITSPNNPDGANTVDADLASLAWQKPTIHDAAYYSPIYLPEGQTVEPHGDLQIYSASKMYGLSGLRVGYVVCRNENLYKKVAEHVETTTAGVSVMSQDMMRNLELIFKQNPKWYDEFTKEARQALINSRAELSKLDPDVLTVEPCESNSMFAWCKVRPALNNKAAKVHILPGEIFGKPGYVRLNIAYPVETISEAVSRLNKHKI